MPAVKLCNRRHTENQHCTRITAGSRNSLPAVILRNRRQYGDSHCRRFLKITAGSEYSHCWRLSSRTTGSVSDHDKNEVQGQFISMRFECELNSNACGYAYQRLLITS